MDMACQIELALEHIRIHPGDHLVREIPAAHLRKHAPQGIVQRRAAVLRRHAVEPLVELGRVGAAAGAAAAENLVGLGAALALDRLVHAQRGEEVGGRLVVAANVDAADAEVVARAHKVGVDAQRLLVGGNGLLRLARVGERRAEAVPEQVQLLLLRRVALGRRVERRREAVDGLVVVLGAVEEDAEPDLHVGVHVLAVGRQLRRLDEEVRHLLAEHLPVGEAELRRRVQRRRVDDLRVPDREPALQRAVRRRVVALVCVGHGERHERRRVGGVELDGLLEGAQRRRLLFVLCLRLAEIHPRLHVARVLLRRGLKGEGRQRQVAALAHDAHALVKRVLLVDEDVVLLEQIRLDDGVAEPAAPVVAAEALEIRRHPVLAVKLVERRVAVDHGARRRRLGLDALPYRLKVAKLVRLGLHGPVHLLELRLGGLGLLVFLVLQLHLGKLLLPLVVVELDELALALGVLLWHGLLLLVLLLVLHRLADCGFMFCWAGMGLDRADEGWWFIWRKRAKSSGLKRVPWGTLKAASMEDWAWNSFVHVGDVEAARRWTAWAGSMWMEPLGMGISCWRLGFLFKKPFIIWSSDGQWRFVTRENGLEAGATYLILLGAAATAAEASGECVGSPLCQTVSL
ncbi:hypothetical protein BN1708_006738 [Verticillium longisporum]|uniref:Uncharacterized protein n=1 Tax=Verticillium longisporum TaxID=100787 RepID=A0A0G4MMK5_VERLO|nr:hypothetical protein BN1708_006738 [Verticillium longisporum]